MQKSLSELAAAGLLGGALLVTDAALANEGISVDTHRLQPLSERERAYYAVHDCAGLNVCRGLGGCKVSNATLHKLARQAGVDPWTAGLAHDCAGKNECKGLGGCRVSAETFAKLKAQLPQYSEVHNCSGLNSCLGLGGCKVTKNQLRRLAKAAGVSEAEAGAVHDCAGNNACKGLGGCKVSAELLQKLKAENSAE